MNTLKKFITALTLSALGFTFTANATPITEWGFIVDTFFTDSTHQEEYLALPTLGLFEELLPHPDGDPTKLRWGDKEDEDLRSYLDVSATGVDGWTDNGRVEGMIETNGAAVQTAELVHFNWPIPLASKLLETAELTTSLSLTYPGDGTVFPPTLIFDILFRETVNTEPCDVPSDPDFGPCDDIFIIGLSEDSGEATIDPLTGDIIQFFSVDEYLYQITIVVGGIFPINDSDICGAVGAGNPCVGLTTHERFSNGFAVMTDIRLVPEPSTVLLMSLALFGIVASMRNKHI